MFFEPESPFFLLTLQVGGATLGVFIVCGIIFEVYQRKGRKMVQTGKFVDSYGQGDQTIFLTASILVTCDFISEVNHLCSFSYTKWKTMMDSSSHFGYHFIVK